MFGAGLHVVAEPGETVVQRIRDCLTGSGHAVAGVQRVAPSLEDTFVTLIEERDRAERAPQEGRQ